MAIQVTLSEAKIADFCQRHCIRKLALFGSVLRTDFRPDSAIDVLVEFEPDAHVGWEIIDMADELQVLLRRKVDLHTANSLSLHFREKVLQSAQVIYKRTRQDALSRHVDRSTQSPQIFTG